MSYNETLDEISLNVYKKGSGSSTLYVVLLQMFLVISTVISAVFVCFYWYSKKDNVRVKFNSGTQTTIY